MGWLPASAGSKKSGSTWDTSTGDVGAGHCIVCLVIHTYRRGMLLSLDLDWLLRLPVLLAGSIHCYGMGLPGPASGGLPLCHLR